MRQRLAMIRSADYRPRLGELTLPVGYIGGGPLHWLARVGMGVAAICLIIPGTTTDIIGAVIYTAIVVWQVLRYRKIKKAAEPAAS